MNSHAPTMVSAWRANCDAQFITDPQALPNYLLKYLNKPEEKSTYLQRVRELATKSNSTNESAKRAVQSLLMATVGGRDYSAQESAHHLLSLPMYFCSRTFEKLNTSGLRAVDSDGTLCNHLDRYQKRHVNHESLSLFLFVQTKKSNRARGAEAQDRKVVVVKPKYVLTTKKPQLRELYFQQLLILHVPWRNSVDELKGDFATWEEAYNAKKPQHFGVRLDLSDLIQTPEDEVPSETEKQPPLETEGYHVGTHEVPHAADEVQEDWMDVQEDPGRLFQENLTDVRNAYATVNQDPNFDWHAAAVDWDATGAAEFIQEMRLLHPGREHTLVTADVLNGEQREIYDTVMMHSTSTDATKKPLVAVVLGTAGTRSEEHTYELQTP
jgi:hypothetical protein